MIALKMGEPPDEPAAHQPDRQEGVRLMAVTEEHRPTEMKPPVFTKPFAPSLGELTAPQELALLARCLFAEGYNDHLAGHITSKQPDGNFLVNPFGLTWDELRASDVMTMDSDGNTLDG